MFFKFASNCCLAGLCLAATPLQAAEWSYASPALEPATTVTIEPLLYGKTWGYAIEIDDGPASTEEIADFFAAYKWTDAPPGVKGGREMPIVGSAAIIAGSVGANPKSLDWDGINRLAERGWGLANHSYSHRGRTFGDPPEILTADELREELYWSQAMMGHKTGLGRAPTHLVYPNGYKPYSEHLAEFYLRSASLVGGSGGRSLSSPELDLTMVPRNYLDEGYWARWGKANTLFGLPEEGDPPLDDLIIDFTHGMNPDPESENKKRWTARMEAITERFGINGADNFWNAPAEHIINYKLAAAKAEVQLQKGKLTVQLPDDIPGSALTLRLENLPASAQLPAPEGGTLHRQGTTAWLTTPVLGRPGAPLPEPAIKMVHKGPLGEYVLPAPARIAGVIIQHSGKPEDTLEVRAEATTPDGATELIGTRTMEAGKYANGAMLLATIPARPAPLASKINVPPSKTLHSMEIWVLAE